MTPGTKPPTLSFNTIRNTAAKAGLDWFLLALISMIGLAYLFPQAGNFVDVNPWAGLRPATPSKSRTEPGARQAAPSGPLDWRRLVEWLSADGVIDFSGTYDDYLRSQGVVI